MRILTTLLAATLLLSPILPATLAKDVPIEFFYETLEPYGDWIQTSDYGYVWHPKEAREDWRPYTVGNWAYTDAGWTWVSEEPYGAITYHYGRWTRLEDTGWVWVPDSEWAPAWVSWRRSDEYVGWAPLPPEATFKKEVGISSWSDSYYDVGPSQYSFVDARDFGAPRLATVIRPPRENVTIIRETRNITNISYSERGIYNDGPQYDVIVRTSREPVRRLRLERRDDVEFDGPRVRGDGLRASVVGDALRVFAPAVLFQQNVAPTRVTRRVEHVEVDRGWRNVPQSQDLRARFQQDSPRRPEQLPERPSFMRAAAALGLGATNDRATRNLDGDGRPRTDRGNQGGGSENGRPPMGDRPNGAGPGFAPGERSPATTVRPPRPDGKPAGRPGAETMPNPAEPADRPAAGADRGPGAKPKARDLGDRPGQERPPGTGGDAAKPNAERGPNARGAQKTPTAPETGLAPDSGPEAPRPGRAGAMPKGTTPGAPREGGPGAREGGAGAREGMPARAEGAEGRPARGGEDRPDKPEGVRPGGAPASREGRPEGLGDKPGKRGGDVDRPDRPDRPAAGVERPVPKAAGEGMPRREGAGDGQRKAEGAPENRPGAAAAGAERKEKGKGDKGKDKDKD